MSRRSLIVVCLLLLSIHGTASHANDIAKSVRDGNGSSFRDGGSIELGMVSGYVDNPYVGTQDRYNDWHVNVDAGGEIRYKNFFVEASQGTQDGVNLGYTLWHNKDWSVDLLGASMIGSILDEFDDSDIRASDDEETRNDKLEDQDTFYVGTGFRVTRYINDYVFQYRFVSDTYRNNGIISTIRAGRGWQFRNWHFSAILSAQYSSDDTNNYLYGVNNSEATSRYPAFDANDEMSYGILLNVTRPLTEKWVMRAYLGRTKYSKELKQSPLLEDNDFSVALLSINYVFVGL